MKINLNMLGAVPMHGRLSQLAAQYIDYEPLEAKDIVYYEPQNEEQHLWVQETIKDMIRTRTREKITLALMFGVFAAVICLIFFTELLKGEDMKAVCFLGLTAAVFIFIVVRALLTLPKNITTASFMTGTVVFKNSKRTGNDSRQLYISIIPDSGEKVIYRNVYTANKYYRRISEGTRVVVIRAGAYRWVRPL